MTVEQIMTKSPATCGSDNSLSQAAQTMWDRDCGCLPVTATDQSLRLIGIITDRDICMAAHFHGKSLTDLRVGDAMVKEVYCCSPKDTLEDAEAIMRKRCVRRLPIINESRQVVGLISLADLARQAVRERNSKKRAISEAEIGEVLARICEPRQIGSQTPLS